LPPSCPHDHMILRVDRVGSHGRWKRSCLQTAQMTVFLVLDPGSPGRVVRAISGRFSTLSLTRCLSHAISHVIIAHCPSGAAGARRGRPALARRAGRHAPRRHPRRTAPRLSTRRRAHRVPHGAGCSARAGAGAELGACEFSLHPTAERTKHILPTPFTSHLSAYAPGPTLAPAPASAPANTPRSRPHVPNPIQSR
jgi:hypothetical protein